MITTVVVHRIAWQMLVTPVEARRYVFAIPAWDDAVKRTVGVFNSIVPGVAEQVVAIMDFSVPMAILFVALAAAVAVAFQKPDTSVRRPVAIGVALLLLVCAGFGVIWPLSVMTGHVPGSMPRRYGYVSYSLLAMAMFALLCGARRLAGPVPAMSVGGFRRRAVGRAHLLLSADHPRAGPGNLG